MGYDKNFSHYVVVTGILVRKSDGKYLITKRADDEEAFQSKWTVPGGKLEVLDYALRDKDTPHHWYNVLEDTLKREVKEEVGLDVEEIGYVTSLIFIRKDNTPCLVVSLYAYVNEDKIKLDSSSSEYVWVNIDEAKNYDLIPGIYDEIVMLDKHLKKGGEGLGESWTPSG